MRAFAEARRIQTDMLVGLLKDGDTCAAELRAVPGRDRIAPPPGEPDTGFDPVEAENAA